MRRVVAVTAMLLLAALDVAPASAGVYTDDLSKCLVASSSQDDQAALVRWMFAALALNPVVKPLSSVTAAQRDRLDRKAAALFQRLLLADCHKASVAALKYEGPHAFEAGFAVLGQVAARSLLGNPAVAAGMKSFYGYADRAGFDRLYDEAGIPRPPAPASR